METLKHTAYEAACYDAAKQFARNVVTGQDWERELQRSAVERGIEPHHIIEALCRINVTAQAAAAVEKLD